MTAQHTAVQATSLPGRHAAVALLAAGLAAAAVVAVGEPAATTFTPAMPLPAREQISAALGAADLAYHATTAGGQVALANPRHGLRASFTPRGVRVHAGTTVALSLRSAGRGAALASLPAARPRAAANRVEYRRGALTEWYLNGPAGLEQGFTLARRPAGAGLLTLALDTNRPAALDGDRRGAVFGSLAYRGLWAADARGRELPAWLELRRERLLIRVDDRGAHYPLTIDPFFQAAKLRASDPNQDDDLGTSVAVSGDTIAAGAPGDDNGRGSVYVFTRGPNGWFDGTQAAKLTAIANDRMTGDHLGQTVAISGDTIVAGAPDKNLGHPEEGALYVFVRPLGGWANGTTTARLTATDRAEDDHLGSSVSVSGGTIVAGATGDDPQGSAYVYVKPPSGWTDNAEDAKLTVSGAADSRFFGDSVGVSGDTIVVGAPLESFLRGSAYVYVKPVTGWDDMAQTAKLTPQGGQINDEFGHAVAIDGNTIAVGARRHDILASNPNDDQGAAYVFVKPAAGWASGTQTAVLTASEAAARDELGTSVAVSGDTIVAGVPGRDAGATLSAGAVYAFARPATGWVDMKQTAALIPAGAATFDQVGTVSGISGTTVAGASRTADTGRGALYVFENDNAAPAAPSLTATDPGSPANANTVRVRGTAEPASIVRLYAGDCTGPPLATGPAADLAGAGVAVSLADDSVTALRATATDRAGNTSACSGALTFVEDSAPPAPPVLAGTSPGSPGNAAAVRVTGSAEPGSIVRVYTGACAGPAAAEGPEAGLAGGLAVAVAENAATTLRAAATDPVGNSSACSDPLTFVEDSTAPAAPTIRGPRKRNVGDTATYVATVSDSGGGGIDAAAVQWTPGRGLAAARGTAATFTFRAPGTYTIRAMATDRAGNPSAAGTLRVQVQRARLVLTASDRWRFFPAYTLTQALRARKVPAGATLRVRCMGAPVRKGAQRDCPFRTRSFKATAKIRDVDLLRFFKGRRLKPGTTIELSVSASGAVGRVLRYRMRASKLPTLTVRCGGKRC